MNKKIIDEYIVKEVLKTSIEVSIEVLLKILSKKYLNFLVSYNIQPKSEIENRKMEKYFKEKYIKEFKNK